MHEDLQAIADLKISELAEKLSRLRRETLRAQLADLNAKGEVPAGAVGRVRLNSAIDGSLEIVRGVYTVWIELIVQRNKGRLTRSDADFVKERLRAASQVETKNIREAVADANSVTPEIADRRSTPRLVSLVTDLGRELEIKLREQEAFHAEGPDLSFFAFLRAFMNSWFTRMSGPLTVPLALLGAYFEGYARAMFVVLAILCGVLSSYYVWRSAKLGAS